MSPWLWSGDSLQFERCGEDALRPGDIALIRTPHGAAAHIVRATRPLVTVNSRGVADKGADVLGRAVALRRGGRTLPLGFLSRPLVRVAAAAGSSEAARGTFRAVRALAFGAATAKLRRTLLSGVSIRALGNGDAPALTRFAGDYLTVDVSFLLRQLEQRWANAAQAFGAVTARGALVGFVYVDAYQEEGVPLPGEWVRYLFVAPHARHLGVAEELVRAACSAAKARGQTDVHADVLAVNCAALALFAKLGFQPNPWLSEKLDAAMRGARGDVVALTLSL